MRGRPPIRPSIWTNPLNDTAEGSAAPGTLIQKYCSAAPRSLLHIGDTTTNASQQQEHDREQFPAFHFIESLGHIGSVDVSGSDTNGLPALIRSGLINGSIALGTLG